MALQSTGVYWIPLYEILEERGFEVYLVNARHTKNLPGRKSDVQESQWLLKLGQACRAKRQTATECRFCCMSVAANLQFAGGYGGRNKQRL